MRSRTISTFSACAERAGSIAGADSAFQTVAAGDAVDAGGASCGNVLEQPRHNAAASRKGFLDMSGSPGLPLKHSAIVPAASTGQYTLACGKYSGRAPDLLNVFVTGATCTGSSARGTNHHRSLAP